MSTATDISIEPCAFAAATPDPRSELSVPPYASDWSAGTTPAAAITSCRIAGARRMSNAAFVDAIADAYRLLGRHVAQQEQSTIVRLWNGVPGIHDRVDTTRDRYMLFNAGRFAAMREWFAEGDLALAAPAASGVGIDGDDFVLHALSIAGRGTAVQNPQQTPAALYSRRYGPRPPCFARATRIELPDHPRLLVSGTAAILGEDSQHIDDLDRQLALTLDNLTAVVRAASGASATKPHASLAAYSSLRVYLTRIGDRPVIESALRRAARPDCAIEFVHAQLCRAELLVEIEGVADLAVA